MAQQNPPNVRFWTWHKGDYVKITLRPNDDALQLYEGDYTDEGWYRESLTVEYSPRCGEVIAWRFREERDCDGLHSTETILVCDVENLGGGVELDGGEKLPKWEVVSDANRDFTAESMGY